MNASVLVWWFLGDPLDWIMGPRPVHSEQDSRNILQKMFDSLENRRRRLEKVLFVWADTQTVTGLALTIAGLIQINNLSLYHIAVLTDLLSISANGQAAILIYAFAQVRTQQDILGAATPTSKRKWYKRIWIPRALISIAYLGTYLALASIALSHFDNANEHHQCLLNHLPRFGNYGGWTVFEAVFTLCLNVLAFAQLWLPHQLLKKSWLKIIFAPFLPIYITVIYLLNLVDIVQLREANKPTLNEGTGEDVISSFGQVVPLVMIILVGMSLWSLFDED
jgi:hypothetical protein